jgi:hypothetical protein
MKLSHTALWFIASIVLSILAGCRSPDVQKTVRDNNDRMTIAGGFWEGYSPLVPSNYYGFTFVESGGELLGTCFQGGKDGIRLYFLEKCTLRGNHLEGWKAYPPCNVEEMVEGTFDGDSCRFIEYYIEGHAAIVLHRVTRLSRTPDVFHDRPGKNQ